MVAHSLPVPSFTSSLSISTGRPDGSSTPRQGSAPERKVERNAPHRVRAVQEGVPAILQVEARVNGRVVQGVVVVVFEAYHLNQGVRHDVDGDLLDCWLTAQVVVVGVQDGFPSVYDFA